MAQLDLNMIIVIAYLLVTLFVGIYTGRNIKSINEYAIGNRKFSTTALIATITATWISAGSMIGTHEKIYQFGIVWMFIFMAGVLEIIIFQFIAPKIIKFQGSLTAAEILGKWYGKKARTIGGICILLLSIGIIATQVRAMGYLFKEFFGVEPFVGILLGTGIVVLYSSFGGIKSVTYTDIVQFGFFVVAVPLIASVMLAKVGGFGDIINKVPTEHLKIFPSYGTKSEYIMLCLFFIIPLLDPCLVQRVLMAKDKQQITVSFKSTAVVMFLFYMICCLIALSALAINPNLEPNNVIYYVVNNYLPYGVKGIAIAGLVAVVMSTVDSYLNVSAVSIIHDVVNPLKKRALTLKQELLITKITALVIGIGAIIVAINFASIVEIMIKAWIIWAPIVVIPLYAAILGFKSNFRIFVFSVIAGILITIFWEVFEIEKSLHIDVVIPGLFLNLLVFTLSTIYYRKFAPDKLYKPDLADVEEKEIQLQEPKKIL